MPQTVWDLVWRDRGVVRGLDKVGDANDRAARKAKAFNAAVGVGLVVAAGAAIRFGRESVKAYGEAQTAQAKLSDAFARFPKLADTNQAALQRLNSERAKTTRFDDDATAAAQAQLAQYKLTGQQITQLTPLVQDYAARTGKDLPTAAKDAGRALLGQGRAFKSIGLDLKDTGTQTGNYTQLVKGLRTQVGGFAEKEGKTAAGQVEILKNQFGELQEQAGEKLLPAVSAVVGVLTDLVGVVGDNATVIVPLAGGVAGLTAAVWLGHNAVKAYTAVQGTLGVALAGNSRAASAFGAVVSKAGPWGLAIGTGATLLGLFAGQQEKAKRETRSFTDALTFQKGALDDNSRQTLIKKLADEGALEAAKRAGVAESDYVRALLQGGPVRDRMIEQLTNTGIAARANVDAFRGDMIAQEGVADSAFEAADKLKLMGGGLDASKRAADLAEGAYRATATATVDLGKQQRDLRIKLGEAKTELQNLMNKMTIFRTGSLDAEQANLAWEEAIDGVTSSAKENGRSLSDNTEKGRTNRRAILSAMTALNDKTTADFKGAAQSKNSAKATREASERYKDNRAALVRAALAAGYSREEVRKMIGQYLKTPKKLDTDVTADTRKARAQIKALQERLALTKSRQAWINFSTNADEVRKKFGVSLAVFRGSTAAQGGPRKRAGGGPIPGWSPHSRADNIPVLATAGEYYHQKPTVDYYGHRVMDDINQRRIPREVLRRARGGPISRSLNIRTETPNVGWMPPAANQIGAALARTIANKLGGILGAALEAATASTGSTFTSTGKFGRWSAEQMRNAATIATVGAGMGRRAQTIGIATAIVESGLRNLGYGDRDSVGLFQQRAPWGPRSARMNPRTSAGMFFRGGQGGQRGLEDVPWRQLSMGRAAQAVQVSAFPGRYQTQVANAVSILNALSSTGTSGGGPVGGALGGRGRMGARAAGLRLGARSVGTYPGHHPSMNRAWDFMTGSRRAVGDRIAAHLWAHRKHYNLWYLIHWRKIISMTRPGAGWQPYTRSNPHTDHVHASFYDRGGILRSGRAAVNRSGANERILSPRQTNAFDRMVKHMDRGGGAGTTVIINAPNYVGNRDELRDAMLQMVRSNRFQVLTR